MHFAGIRASAACVAVEIRGSPAGAYNGDPGWRDDWIVANLESDTRGGRTGWTGSWAPQARYAGAGHGAGVKTDVRGCCVACTGSADAYAKDPEGRDD